MGMLVTRDDEEGELDELVSMIDRLMEQGSGHLTIDIDENDLWQVLEAAVMKFDDYQAILDKGYANWLHEFLVERLGDPETTILPFLQNSPVTIQRVAEEAQVPVMNGLSNGTPFEGFCGGRQLMNFFMDLYEEPELVKSALDAAFEHVRATIGAVQSVQTLRPSTL